jgi:glycosyltransferase involved in cell wall biosynthesis
VLDQTYRDFEVIVVDDGSTDNTREVLAPWVQSGAIQYIYQENRGPGGASTTGLNLAKGELISFLDGDDMWLPSTLEWLVQYLDAHPEIGAVGGGHIVVDETGTPIRPPFVREKEFTFEDTFEAAPFASIGAALVRKHLVLAVGGFDETVWSAQDFDMWLRLAAKGCRIVSLARVALYYRRHGGNISGGVIKMFPHCEKVIRIHLREIPRVDRARVRLYAIKGLYKFQGRLAIRRCKDYILKGHLTYFAPLWKILRSLIPVAAGDPPFLWKILTDLLVPARFKAGKPEE